MLETPIRSLPFLRCQGSSSYLEKLFKRPLKLLQQAEDRLDLQEAEEPMSDSTQERVGFGEFFAELETSCE